MIDFILNFDASSITIAVVGFLSVTVTGIGIKFVGNLINNNKELMISITQLNSSIQELSRDFKDLEKRMERLEAPHFK